MRQITVGVMIMLFIVFLILKLAEVIDWPWLWVLSPLWIPFSMAFTTAFFCAFFDYSLKDESK